MNNSNIISRIVHIIYEHVHSILLSYSFEDEQLFHFIHQFRVVVHLRMKIFLVKILQKPTQHTQKQRLWRILKLDFPLSIIQSFV